MNDGLRRTIREYFEGRRPGPVAVYLFGSEARGTAGEGSDADVALLYSLPPPSTFAAQPYDYEGELERLLGRPVDLIVLNRAPVDLRARVLRDGELLLETDRAARIAFEVRTRNEAFDFERVLQEYRAARPVRR